MSHAYGVKKQPLLLFTRPRLAAGVAEDAHVATRQGCERPPKEARLPPGCGYPQLTPGTRFDPVACTVFRNPPPCALTEGSPILQSDMLPVLVEFQLCKGLPDLAVPGFAKSGIQVR